ncbi:hypothetical protein MMC22_003309 [Lobaria immixta]|nr:hypothetical protein [Lobaria immixta]
MSFQEIYKLYGTRNHLLFEEENVLRYRPGGYHPVAIGDTLKAGRYKIYHKLGCGGFSTVWVARDNTLEQWVSVKIMTADMTNKSRELQNLQTLAEHSKGSLGAERIVQLLDNFLHDGPNGCHQCLVFELLGPDVYRIVTDYAEDGDRLEVETIFKISTQLLEGMAFMHDAGYAHGDLSIRNLVFTCSHLSHLSEEELFEILGPLKTKNLAREDGEPLGKGVPNQLVKSASWVGWPDDKDEDDDDIRIIDLGEGFIKDDVPEKLAQPGDLQAPETIFSDRFDYRLDLWRAGLIIYYLAFGYLPFSWWSMYTLVREMIELLGELPPEWQPKWEQLKLDGRKDVKLFKLGDKCDRSGPTLDQEFHENAEKVHEPELMILLPVIKGLIRYLPSDRISAAQALDMIRDKCTNAQQSGAIIDGSDIPAVSSSSDDNSELQTLDNCANAQRSRVSDVELDTHDVLLPMDCRSESQSLDDCASAQRSRVSDVELDTQDVLLPMDCRSELQSLDSISDNLANAQHSDESDVESDIQDDVLASEHSSTSKAFNRSSDNCFNVQHREATTVEPNIRDVLLPSNHSSTSQILDSTSVDCTNAQHNEASDVESDVQEVLLPPDIQSDIREIVLPADPTSTSQALDLTSDNCANAQHNKASTVESDIQDVFLPSDRTSASLALDCANAQHSEESYIKSDFRDALLPSDHMPASQALDRANVQHNEAPDFESNIETFSRSQVLDPVSDKCANAQVSEGSEVESDIQKVHQESLTSDNIHDRGDTAIHGFSGSEDVLKLTVGAFVH